MEVMYAYKTCIAYKVFLNETCIAHILNAHEIINNNYYSIYTVFAALDRYKTIVNAQ